MLTWTWSEPHIAEKLFLSKQSVLWVWYLSSTWHKNCSHLLSTHPFSCHAYVTIAVMLKDLAGPDTVKKNEKSSSLYCATGLRLTTCPGHQQPSLWSVDTWDLLFLCPRMSLSNSLYFLPAWHYLQAKMSNLLLIISLCSGTSLFAHGSVAILKWLDPNGEKWICLAAAAGWCFLP